MQLICRNIFLRDRRTSIRLDTEIWEAAADVCTREGLSLHELCDLIDRFRGTRGLTTALRIFLLFYFRVAATEDGHRGAGHGDDGTGRPAAERFQPLVVRVLQG